MVFGGMHLVTAGVALLPLFFSLQDSAASPQSQAAVQADATRLIAKGTAVEIEITAPVGSVLTKPGDFFPIRTVAPIAGSDGAILVPVGTEGVGQVVHAAKAGFGGKPGELIVNARYLQCGDTRVPLGHFNFLVTGADNSKSAALVNSGVAGASALAPLAGVAVIVPFMIKGGEVVVPAGTHALAKVTADTAMTDAASASCLAAPN